MKPLPQRSAYYKYPDGDDFPGKISYVLSRSVALGTGIGFLNAKWVETTKPLTVLQTLGRVAYWNVPFAAISSTFVATTYILTNIRKKDDQLNYALGGATAGAVFGAWSKSTRFGFVACALFSLAGILKKQSVEEGWLFCPPDFRRPHATIGTPHFDFTLTPDNIRGNWTRGDD